MHTHDHVTIISIYTVEIKFVHRCKTLKLRSYPKVKGQTFSRLTQEIVNQIK